MTPAPNVVFPPVLLYFVHVLYIAFDPEASILYTSYLNCRACWEDRLVDTLILSSLQQQVMILWGPGEFVHRLKLV